MHFVNCQNIYLHVQNSHNKKQHLSKHKIWTRERERDSKREDIKEFDNVSDVWKSQTLPWSKESLWFREKVQVVRCSQFYGIECFCSRITKNIIAERAAVMVQYINGVCFHILELLPFCHFLLFLWGRPTKQTSKQQSKLV